MNFFEVGANPVARCSAHQTKSMDGRINKRIPVELVRPGIDAHSLIDSTDAPDEKPPDGGFSNGRPGLEPGTPAFSCRALPTGICPLPGRSRPDSGRGAYQKALLIGQQKRFDRVN